MIDAKTPRELLLADSARSQLATTLSFEFGKASFDKSVDLEIAEWVSATKEALSIVRRKVENATGGSSSVRIARRRTRVKGLAHGTKTYDFGFQGRFRNVTHLPEGKPKLVLQRVFPKTRTPRSHS